MKTSSLAPRLRDLGGSSPSLPLRLENDLALVRRLDGAGVGERWLATRNGNETEQVVLRIVPRNSVSADQAGALEQQLLQASQTPPHPHLAPLVAAEISGDCFVVAASQVEGDDLATLVEQTGPLPLDLAAECLRQALLGFQHAHQHQVTHGNVKPSDLVVDFDGILKICNWGCAPLAAGCDGSAAGDLRGLGDVLYFLLAGCEPPSSLLNRRDAAANREAAFALRQGRPHVPRELAELCVGLWSAGAAGGFATADEALGALNALWPVVQTAAAEEVRQWCSCEKPDGNEASESPARAASTRECSEEGAVLPPGDADVNSGRSVAGNANNVRPADSAPLRRRAAWRVCLWLLALVVLLTLAAYFLWP